MNMARKREYAVTGNPAIPPPHPGVIIRDDVLPALGLSVSEAARQLGITRQTLHRIMNGSMAISPEMAVRLGKFCGNGPWLWIRMQAAHDLWHAEKRMAQKIASIPTHTGRQAA